MSKKPKSIEEAAENARWISFVIEYVFAVVSYIAIKATCGIACAELFMLITFALALCASTKSASELVKEELKKTEVSKREELDGKEEQSDSKEDKDKDSDKPKDA